MKRPEPATVADLIRQLSQFPQDMPVMLEGYEAGYDYPGDIRVADVGARGYDANYFGRFDTDTDCTPKFPAVLINREP
jgi:hypothetical protein